MMSLPFFAQAIALGLVFAGRRGPALIVWALSIVVLLVLFKLHATDSLAIDL